MSYFKLMDLKEYINDTFSLQLFLSIVSFFIESVYFVFFIIVILRAPENQSGQLTTPKTIRIAVWANSIFSKMLFLITTCNFMAQKIKKTKKIINNMLTEPLDSETKNEVSQLCTFITYSFHNRLILIFANYF